MSNAHITSPTAAIKIILGGCNPASFKTKEVLAQLAEHFPHIQTHYRFVFGTLKRLAKSYEQPSTDNLAMFASQVIDYAKEHYESSGWDIVVETMTYEEIQAELVAAGVKTTTAALHHFTKLAGHLASSRHEQLAEVF